MNKPELIETISSSDYILPKDIFSTTEIDKLAHMLLEIFAEHRDRIENEEKFQRN